MVAFDGGKSSEDSSSGGNKFEKAGGDGFQRRDNNFRGGGRGGGNGFRGRGGGGRGGGFGNRGGGGFNGNRGGGNFNDKFKRFNNRNGDGEDPHSNGRIVPIFDPNNVIPIEKNNYKEAASVTERSSKDLKAFMKENNASVNGRDPPNPIMEFDESGFPEAIVKQLYSVFQKPTAIQSLSWPLGMSGRDLIAISKTGSGKTVAFMLPAIVHIKSQPLLSRGDGPIVLVLTPTRELAQQVQQVCQDFCTKVNVRSTCVYGGASKGPQIGDLKRGSEVCVACPGRMNDLLEMGVVNLQRCSFVVLDEADRMLDMGFEPQIRKIIELTRPDRQTLMYSATWPKEVQKLASEFLTDPIQVTIGSEDLAASHNITQIVEVCQEGEKHDKLMAVLKDIDLNASKVLIFVDTKRKANELHQMMREDGFRCLCIHGDKAQNERDFVMNKFKNSSTNILIATDVAARGLHVDDINTVINYEYANCSEDYVHRIGRTGRVNSKGTAYTFFTYKNGKQAKDLVKVLEEAKQNVPAELYKLAEKFRGQSSYSRYSGGGGNSSRGRFGLGKRAFSSYDQKTNSFGQNDQGFGSNKKIKFSEDW